MSAFTISDLPPGCRIHSVERGKCDTTVMVYRESDAMYFGVCIYDALSERAAQAEVDALLVQLRDTQPCEVP